MPDASRRWEAIRALAEGALPTHTLLAAACGIYKSNISRRAKLDGWVMLDFRRTKVRAAHRVLMELAGGEIQSPAKERRAPRDGN